MTENATSAAIEVRSGGGAPPVRVAHVIHSLGPGGAEHVLVELAAVAETAGIDMVVIALSPVPEPVHAGELRALGVPVVELGRRRWDPRAIRDTVRELRHHGVQVVHTHLKHGDLVGSLAATRLGLPSVSTLHLIESAPARSVDRLKRRLGVLGRRTFSARTMAVSTAQRRWYEELVGVDDVVVVPNGVADPGLPTPTDRDYLRSEVGVRPDGLLVMSASLMRPEKGHHLLLDAVERIPTDEGLVVGLAGDGPLCDDLARRVEGSDRLRRRVRMLGYRNDVPALLGASDIVLHTSLADALPTTLIHALAVGTPIVATDVGGISDIVGADAGLLVPTEPTALAAAVVRLAGDPELRARMGAAGRRRFATEFSSTVWARRLNEVYRSVLV